MKNKIYLDMDGVLYNWDKSAGRLLGADYSDRETFKKFVGMTSFRETFGDCTSVVENAGTDFWATLELFPWSKDLYDRLSKITNVVFLTSPGPYTHAYHGKLTAIQRDFNSSSIILTKEKYHLATPTSILIDDMGYNLKEFEKHGGIVYHWPNSHEMISRNNWKKHVDKCVDTVKTLLINE